MTSYAFFDVETPNRRQDAICSIAVRRTDAAGHVECSRHFRVDPEQGFDPQNVAVHGITSSQVKGAPTFARLWQDELADVFAGAVAVAHNAPFDLAVLNKALSTYGLAKPPLDYLDTLDIAKRSRRLALPDYELPTVCAHYGVSLARHHDALADAEACCAVFWAMEADFGPIAQRPAPYVWVPYDPRSKKDSGCDAAMTDLYGIALGLLADGRVAAEEKAALADWMGRNARRRDSACLCDAFDLLERVLADGVVTPQECERIVNLARPFACNGHNAPATVAMQQLIGYLRGVSCDRQVSAGELRELERWLRSLPEGESAELSRVHGIVERVLADGAVTADEEAEVLRLFDEVVDPAAAQGPKGAVEFAGRRFVLTGDFEHGTKAEVEAYIAERGGVVAGSVSGKVSYVVQGALGSEQYVLGNYGSKVKKAMDLQQKGKPIRIITEEALYA